MDKLKKGSNRIYLPLEQQSLPNSEGGVYPPQLQLVVNQPINPKVIYIDTSKYNTSPCPTICPFCKNKINTEVKKSFNWFSFVFCLWAGICCWVGLQYCRNKEINCYDAEHNCPVCHNKLGNYSSC